MSEQAILEQFPDGTPVDPWFYDESVPEKGTGAEYPVNENGISADGSLQTGKIQELIDKVSASGGGTSRRTSFACTGTSGRLESPASIWM